MRRNTSSMKKLDRLERGEYSMQKSIKPTIMTSLNDIERGIERGETSRRKSKYSYIPYSKYAAQTEEEEKLNRLYDIIKQEEKDYSEKLEQNKNYLEDLGEKAHEATGERYNVPLQSKTSFKNTTGVNIGLNEKDKSSPYGFFSLDFRGGKTKSRRTKGRSRKERTRKGRTRKGTSRRRNLTNPFHK